MKIILFIFISIIALTATLSGLLMISDPQGGTLNLPPGLLEGTPFKNYLYPGVLLFLLVGATNIIAVYTNIARSTTRYSWSMAGGTMITVWIITQAILIQSLRWQHLVYLGVEVLVILISYQLKGKGAA